MAIIIVKHAKSYDALCQENVLTCNLQCVVVVVYREDKFFPQWHDQFMTSLVLV